MNRAARQPLARPMAWLELRFRSTKIATDRLSELLGQLGAEAVTVSSAAEQALLEPPPGAAPLWDSTLVAALYTTETEIGPILESVHHVFPGDEVEYLGRQSIADRDWERAGLEGFVPLRFGERLWICPSWHEPPDSSAVIVRLDPGLAFGTGTHATTALCLEALARRPPVGIDVLDYGCGSGILALAAAALGARHVWAVDHDPQALTATNENAAKNAFTERVTAVPPEELPVAPVDVLLANILARPLVSLASSFAQRVAAGGRLILSGILEEQVGEMRAAYRAWFAFDTVLSREGWVCLHATRKPPGQENAA